MREIKYIGLEDIEKKENVKNKKKVFNKKRIKKDFFYIFTTKESIVIFTIVLFSFILFFALVNRYNLYSVIDYNSEDIYSLLSKSSVENDRDVYWTINDIVLEILASNYKNNLSVNSYGETNYKFDTSDYYSLLINDYKKYLKKDKFVDLTVNLIESYGNNYENKNLSSEIVPIRKIYKCDDLNGDYYIVQLNTSTDNYIGIKLIKDVQKFNIFYVQ